MGSLLIPGVLNASKRFSRFHIEPKGCKKNPKGAVISSKVLQRLSSFPLKPFVEPL